MNNQNFINECLFALLNAATCGDSDYRYEICNQVNLKKLRKVLEDNGISFNMFDENSAHKLRRKFSAKSFAKSVVSNNKTTKEYMSKHWFPFSNAEIKAIQVEVDKLNNELKNPKYTKVKDFDKAKSKGDGIEKIYVLLKVLANEKLIELVDGSYAITINEKVDIKEIFGSNIPDIDTSLGWYQKKDCEKVLPKLSKAAIENIDDFDAKVIKFIAATDKLKMFVENGNIDQ